MMRWEDSTKYDRELCIYSDIIDDSFANENIYRFEPTPYSILEKIVSLGIVLKEDCVLDIGCGYGRVPIYFNHVLGCKTYGIDIVYSFYLKAQRNKIGYEKQYGKSNVTFVNNDAERWIPEDANVFYFFCPFPFRIYKKVLHNILSSHHKENIKIILYYAQKEVIEYMKKDNTFYLSKCVDCFETCGPKNDRNKIYVFQVCL